MLRRRDYAFALLVLWVLFDFWFNARGFVPTMRYFIPIYPAMVVLAAFGLVSLWDAASSGRAAAFVARHWRSLAPSAGITRVALQGTVILVVAATLLWALAFTGIYRQDISRAQASRWIPANIPLGSTLSYQEWDDGVPLNLPGLPPSNVFKS